MRYLPLTDADRAAMLAAIGAPSIDALFVDAPAAAYGAGPLDLPAGMSELQVERVLGRMAAKNLTAGAAPFFCGAGAYKHHVPAAVDHLIQRGEFLTAYTPYQPEIAQGTLQYLFEFQSQVALLTGMEVSNASLYDGSTATVEAVLMANRATKRAKALLCGGLHPHYAEVIATHGRLAGFDVVAQPAAPAPVSGGDELASLIAAIDRDTSCVVVQNPSFFGAVRDLRPVADACHAVGALLIAVVTEVVSLGAILPPGAMGADIVAAEGQSLGAGLNFGGPNLGLFAASEKLLRQMPGRLVGQTTDLDGRRGWVLTLSAREQHIRRDKATSNICTNSGLIALAFSIHLTLLGEVGLRQLAALNHAHACLLADTLTAIPGVSLVTERFFNEFTLRLPKPAAEVVEALAARGILGGVPVSRLLPERTDLADLLLVACTECATADDMTDYAAGLSAVLAR